MCGLVGIDKTLPVQVADGHHTSPREAKYVFALVDDRKTPQTQVADDDHHECKLEVQR